MKRKEKNKNGKEIFHRTDFFLLYSKKENFQGIVEDLRKWMSMHCFHHRHFRFCILNIFLRNIPIWKSLYCWELRWRTLQSFGFWRKQRDRYNKKIVCNVCILKFPALISDENMRRKYQIFYELYNTWYGRRKMQNHYFSERCCIFEEKSWIFSFEWILSLNMKTHSARKKYNKYLMRKTWSSRKSNRDIFLNNPQYLYFFFCIFVYNVWVIF